MELSVTRSGSILDNLQRAITYVFVLCALFRSSLTILTRTSSTIQNTSIQYGLVGPARLFASAIYSPLLWGFLVGAVAPAIIYALHRTFPKARFDLWNTTIFFGA